MNNKFTVYLAGKMSGLTMEEMNLWRFKAERLLREASENQIHTINPVDFYNFEIDPNSYTDKEVKEFDLHMVKRSNLILIDMDRPDSIGTAIEVHMASEWKIPVVGFGKTKNHPWIELCLTKRCDTLEESVDYIMNYYYPNM